jgi:hypothetical protein
MIKHRLDRAGPPALVLAWAVAQAGCCQPCCPQPGTVAVSGQPSTVRYGSVCEAPRSGSTIVSQVEGEPPTIAKAPRPKIVVSGPSGWRRSDPENNFATRLEGAGNDDTIKR